MPAWWEELAKTYHSTEKDVPPSDLAIRCGAVYKLDNVAM